MSVSINTNKGIGVKITGVHAVREISARYNLLPQEVKKASARAINRTLRSVRTLGARIAREAYTAPTRELTKRIVIKNAKANDNVGQISFAGTKGVPLHLFLPNPKVKPDWKGVSPLDRKPKAGVSTKIKKTGQRKVKFGPDGQKPFWVDKNKARGLFYRFGKERNEIKPLFGPSPVQALMNDDAQKRLYEQADTTFNTRLQHEVKRIAEKMK